MRVIAVPTRSHSLLDIPTPRVVVDRARLARNVAAMQAAASKAGVRLRPHAKTHKSPVIAEWQVGAGAVGICCAKLGEAEVFVEEGIEDIRLPYPLQPTNAERVVALLDSARISIIVDDLDVARGWSAAMTAAGRTLDVLVKVDVGFHRCGIDPDRHDVVDVIRAVAGLPGLKFCGLLSHAGHAYHATSEADLERIATTEAEIMARLRQRLEQAGVPVAEVSVGSTPTARFIGRQPGVTEMRPGNYVFFDRTQTALGAAGLDDCAQTVVSTVVSRPAADRVILDAGSKTLTNDTARGFTPTPGYGALYPSLTAAAPDPALVIERLSEEHATVRVPSSCALRPGDRVRILPNHACTVMNLMTDVLFVEGMDVLDEVHVAARGRIW